MKATGLRFTEQNKAAALKLLDEWLPGAMLNLPAPEPQGEQPRTVAELFNEFHAAYWQGFTPGVRKLYQEAVTVFFSGKLPAVPLRHRDILERIEQVSRDSKLERSTLQKRREYARMFLDYAVRKEYLATNPAAVAHKLKRQARKDPVIFTPDQVRMILFWFYCQDMRKDANRWMDRDDPQPGTWSRYCLLWKFLYWTGCRIAEALSLKWDAYDGTILTIDGKREQADEPKRRAFPVGAFPEVGELLAELKRYPSPRGYIFPWWRTPTNVTGILNEGLKALDLYRIPERKARKLGQWGRSTKTFRASAKDRWERELGLSKATSDALCGHTKEVAETSYRPKVEGERLAEQIKRERG